MVTENHKNLLKGLQKILEKQAELARRGNIENHRFDELRRQADALIRRIEQGKILDRDEFKKQKEGLQRLYRELCLAIEVQKEDTEREISQTRKWNKTIQTYNRNV
jgi:ribosome recycling factor